MVNAFLLNWKNLPPYAFPPFALIGQLFAKVIQKNVKCHCYISLAIIYMVHTAAENGSSRSSVDPIFPSLLVNPYGHQHPLCQNLTLTLQHGIAGKVFLQKAYQAKLLP